MTTTSTTSKPEDGNETRATSIRYIVRGRVQGVGFRAWTRSVARDLGLVGTVRNLPDGNVEVEAIGDASSLHRFRAALRDGPRYAEVHDVTDSPGSAAPANDFRIIG